MVKVSNFSLRAKQTEQWSTHGLVVAVPCLRTVKNVCNLHYSSLKDIQNRILRKFNRYACNLHLNEQKKKIVWYFASSILEESN